MMPGVCKDEIMWMLVDEKRWEGKEVKQIWMVELIHGCGVVELMSSKESSPRRDENGSCVGSES